MRKGRRERIEKREKDNLKRRRAREETPLLEFSRSDPAM